MAQMTLDQCRTTVRMIGGQRALIEDMRQGPLLTPHLESLEARFEAYEQRPAPEVTPAISEFVQAHMEGIADIAAILDAHRLNPLSAPAVMEAAQRVYDAVVEGHLGRMKAAQRVQIADKVQAALPRLAADLAVLPEALVERIQSWVEIGLAMGDALLRDEPESRPSLALRQDTRTFVRQLRGAVRSEVEINPDLPADLEARLLGWVDNHVRVAVRSRRSAPEAEVEASVEAEVDAVDADCCDDDAPVQPDPQDLMDVESV